MTNTNTRPRLASEERERLRSLGLEGPALELALRASAPARHEWRVGLARQAASDEADRLLLLEGSQHAPQERIEALAALLLAMEHLGQAGPRGLGGPGCGTLRMPWARALGKGRHWASDGAAWDAAIRAAQGRLSPGPLEVAPGDRAVLAGTAALPLTRENAPWVRALTGRVILALAREARWEGDAVGVALDEGIDRPLTVRVRRTDLSTWGVLFGEADRLAKAPAPKPLADLRPDLGGEVSWEAIEAAFEAVSSALDQVYGRTLEEVHSWLSDHGAWTGHDRSVVALDRMRRLPAVCPEAVAIVRAIAAAVVLDVEI